ncbi:hypothetical protein ACIRBX_27595 [Kitasatospora sp. NPDC096147]|uniref:hypothetical protein n=1 Tax=Kitasatospora sp. NPDC096147 TaxID=3364093 RepID=UPI00381AB9FD
MDERTPLLLLDVDGPLSPYTADPARLPEGYRPYSVRPAAARLPRTVHLHPAHGPALLALPYRPVWCSSWGEEANRWISPLLGLPPLPWVDWPSAHGGDPDGLHWKTRRLVAWAAGQPFAWVDDELEPQDAEWIAAHHPGPALTVRVDHRYGLTGAHLGLLAEWAGELRGGAE